jgi:hypothetical protein
MQVLSSRHRILGSSEQPLDKLLDFFKALFLSSGRSSLALSEAVALRLAAVESAYGDS